MHTSALESTLWRQGQDDTTQQDRERKHVKEKAGDDFDHLSQWAVRGVRVGRAEGATGAALWGWGAKLGL